MNQLAPSQQQQQQYYQKEDQQQQPQRAATAQQQQRQPTQSGGSAQQQAPSSSQSQQQFRAPVGDQDTMIIEEKVQMVNGENAIKKYERGPLLGKGGFAKCFSITNMENKKVMAAKIIPKNTLVKNRARQKLVSEIKIHKSLHHTNVVKFEHVFEDHENVYILLELCPHQTLNELIKRRKRITELETMCYIVQIVQALKYLHNNRVIHRDLKLGNLFVGDRMEIKLGDFGLATKLEFAGEKKRTICGTPNYIAPEILDGRVGHSYEVDVWSLGVILYTLLIGKPPFETTDVKKTYGRIKAGQYSFPDHAPISNSAKALIQQILQQDPAKRPTLDDILAHSFISNGGTIPKLLPVTLLNNAPSPSYLKQFEPSATNLKAMQQQQAIPPEAQINQRPITALTKSPTTTNMLKNNMDQMNNNNSNNYFPDDNSNKKGLQPSSQFASSVNLQQNGNKGSFAGQNTDFTSQKMDNNNRPLTTQGISNPNNNQPLSQNSRQQSVQQLHTQSSRQSQQQLHARSSTAAGSESTSTAVSEMPPSSLVDGSRNNLWIAQYVDYTSKYGLGYLLSNGSSGVVFNDGTKIVLEPKGTYLEYISKRDNEEITERHNANEYPPEIQKKVTLLQHFRNYLVSESTKKVLADTNSNNNNGEPNKNQSNGVTIQPHNPNKPLPYLKKWMQTRQAVMFRLSNKIVQVLFTDRTEILLNSQDKLVSFMNKKGERSHYPLADAMASTNVDMTKRLRYTKDILVHLLRNNNRNANNQEGDPQSQQNQLPEAPIDGNNNEQIGGMPSSQFGITSTMENDFGKQNTHSDQQKGMQSIYSQKNLTDKDRFKNSTSQQSLPIGTQQYNQQIKK